MHRKPFGEKFRKTLLYLIGIQVEMFHIPRNTHVEFISNGVGMLIQIDDISAMLMHKISNRCDNTGLVFAVDE